MKLQLVERYLNENIPNFLKESLASHYRDVLTFSEAVPSLYIKYLAYHAIAYFQYFVLSLYIALVFGLHFLEDHQILRVFQNHYI